MEIIVLPALLLAGNLNAAEINQRLRRTEVCLDWSEVTETDHDTLVKLLAGLDLVQDYQLLGGDSVPESISDAVQAALPKKAVKAYPLQKQSTAITPTVWSAETNGDSITSWSLLETLDAVAKSEAGDSAASFEPEETVGISDTGLFQTAPTNLPLVEKGPLLAKPSQAALRDELESMVLADLLGPAAGPYEEVNTQVDSSVRDRYLVGMLAPRGQRLDPEEFDELTVDGEQGGSGDNASQEPSIIQTISFCPSSFGFSFCVDGKAARTASDDNNPPAIRVTAKWGRYTSAHSKTLTKADGNPVRVWKRQPMGGRPALLWLRPGPIEEWSPEPQEQPAVVVKGLVRYAESEDSYTVTLFLVNGQLEPKRNRDESWLFQPELIVEAADGVAPIFQRRVSLPRLTAPEFGEGDAQSAEEPNLPQAQTPIEPPTNAEERAMQMRYRKQVNFAIGHGISVHAETFPTDTTRAVRLKTVSIPSFDVARTEAPTAEELPDLNGLVLDMKELAETQTATELIAKLTPLADAYQTWITAQAGNVDKPENGLLAFKDVAEQAIAECFQTLERIRAGIELLGADPQAAKAFAFLNKAMWQQRIHTILAEKNRRNRPSTLAEEDVAVNRSWRPFQLAFILLNLPSLTDLHHPDRSKDAHAVADLLWFPTGGGKTEAYLGLTAFTLGIRRLKGEMAGYSGDGGVAVIMRYTLRLLTLQQFQRAAALICACETIRREATQAGDNSWGETPFRLGLWVGQNTTPNWTSDSHNALDKAHNQYHQSSMIGGSGTPAQLTNCPWCGSKIDPGKNHIRVKPAPSDIGRTLTFCGDPLGKCAFSPSESEEGLPVVVVDEEIYRLLPDLLIATVDKFAQMPWNGATAMLFGKVEKKCPRHGYFTPDGEIKDSNSHPKFGKLPAVKAVDCIPLRPPDLIIQDELHLISGPLGTLVGLYEAVVDELSSWQLADGTVVRPKVIASTATIRRASQQVHSLFLRQVNIFPPPALDASDNFFARQRPPNEHSYGRRYIGVSASGRRLKAALIRVYVTLLSAGQVLFEKYGEQADPWLTLVGYFNSMNELAGMRRLVEDDVRSRLGKMDKHGLAKRNPPLLQELTSRRSSTEIPLILDLLETPFTINSSSRKNSEAEKNSAGASRIKPLDVLLATNMISVGVDVKRLGLMVVAGQAKTTAEYIQATSRVGRSSPGLVCVVYNWARPRDLSHYEQFEQYHATFYQYVEALSVTPFASRARDRGLAALLVSAMRLRGSEFNPNSAAGKLTGPHLYLQTAIDSICTRASQVTADPNTTASVKSELNSLARYWEKRAKSMTGGAKLGFKATKDGYLNLLEAPSRGEWKPFTCLNSLRDVEPTVNLILDEGMLDISMPSESNEPETVIENQEQEQTIQG